VDRRGERPEDRGLRTLLLLAAAGHAVLALALTFVEPRLLPLIAVPALATVLVARRVRSDGGLQVHQMDRLRQAEVALAGAGTTEAAARELAEHAMALLDAPHATVLIEGIGDTVRVSIGEASGSVFRDGSRMRLLDDDGVPCGSIAVSARADGRPYTEQQERMLDALAQRVSSTLHRLSLFTEIQAERRTLSDVLESSSDGIFTVGLDMVVRSWNPAMQRITQVPATRAVGQSVASVFRPVGEDGKPRYGQADPGRTGRPEVGFVALEGLDEERWLTCSWAPLPEGGYVVVARDDTERKKLQDDKDGWVAQVSHELRTPLTPIKGFLHTLQRRDEQFTHEDRRRIYEVMLREEQRLEDLVSSLLQATSLAQAGLVVALDALDWRTILEQQADLYRRNDPSHEIRVSVGDEVGEVAADRNLATGVVANLLSNALKYSPTGSSIEVGASVDGDRVVTTVCDDGPGVPFSDRERVFDKFTRLGDHLTRPQQGVGLGLFIARQSVERMGGQIWCDDRAGGGALFGFTLPLRAPAAVSERKTTAAGAKSD
jgi:PAS domain S-box-containing protein